MSDKHLWEINHPYYAQEGNYFSPEMHTSFPTWAAFMAEYGDSASDLNLVYRFDWYEGEDHDAGEFTGDVYYRNGRLLVFFMGQRNAKAWSAEAAVCRADEPAVKAWLATRYEEIKALWSPFTDEGKP